MDAITLRRIAGAVINRTGPAGKTGRVRFTAEEVDVLLPHKEIGAVDWVRPVDSFIVVDGDSGYCGTAQCGATGLSARRETLRCLQHTSHLQSPLRSSSLRRHLPP